MSLQIVCYTDGSYNDKTFTAGCGALIRVYKENKKLGDDYHLSLAVDDALIKMRNVTGEIYAVLAAMDIIKKISDEIEVVDAIKVIHDYTGIEHWVRGSWRAKTEETRRYRDLMQAYSKRYNISFERVISHSGVEENETADKLAKKGCGVI